LRLLVVVLEAYESNVWYDVAPGLNVAEVRFVQEIVRYLEITSIEG
jgi:hypothetical protein